jgi:hypothetical protein
LDFIKLFGIALSFGLLIMPVLSLDLTGTWESTQNDGTYYITQLGNTIVLYAEDAPIDPTWSKIAYGTLENDKIVLTFYDIPKGVGKDFLGGSYHSSMLSLDVVSEDELALMQGDRGRSRVMVVRETDTWNRVGSNPFKYGSV